MNLNCCRPISGWEKYHTTFTHTHIHTLRHVHLPTIRIANLRHIAALAVASANEKDKCTEINMHVNTNIFGVFCVATQMWMFPWQNTRKVKSHNGASSKAPLVYLIETQQSEYCIYQIISNDLLGVIWLIVILLAHFRQRRKKSKKG